LVCKMASLAFAVPRFKKAAQPIEVSQEQPAMVCPIPMYIHSHCCGRNLTRVQVLSLPPHYWL
jgi:hypothetical protein